MKKLIAALAVIASFFYHQAHGQNKTILNVKISGNGKQSIIFIPGFASSGQVWDATKAQYEKDHTCYTLTMPGFAGIPAQVNPTFVGWEKLIVDFINDNKIKQPILVGHSMGGGLALAIAADYPDLISKIVVVDALPCLSAFSDSTFQSNPKVDCSEMINAFTQMPDTQFYNMQKMNIPYLCADSAKVEQIVQWSVKSDRKTLGAIFCDFSNTDLRDKISKIKCPCLILLEANFAYAKPAVEKQYSKLKTAQFEYASKGLHFVMFDDKDWFDAQLKSFINKP